MGFTLWRDVHDIEAGADDWWLAIQEAIRECETVILCMSMFALKSSVVGDEWFYARTLGKRIIPVVVDEIWEDEEVKSKKFTIPNWMTRKNWMDFRANTPEADSAWANFIRTLNEKYEPKRFINMVRELPPRFVRRPEELDNAVRSLVDDNNDAVAMTTALKGAGGYGKTTLAKAVARDIRIQGAFDDGILWVTLGEELLSRKGDELKNALIGRVLELIDNLTGQRPVSDSLEMARTKLAEAISDLYILLVIDDVWDEAHLKPFLVKTKHSACLITTRNTDAIRDEGIAKQAIDKMKPIEAVELLGVGIDPDAVKAQDAQLRHLARELREYPLVLALANTQIANYMTDMGLSLADAIQHAQKRLAKKGVLGFDDKDPKERTRAVSATLDVSISQLKPDDQRMYKELAIFPEDAVIPLTTLEKYWDMDDIDTEDFCQLLYRKTALLHSFEGMAIRIHDVFRDYLIRQWTPDQLRDLHQRLITNYGDLNKLSDTYSWLNIGYHLMGASQPRQLRELLLTYSWLDKKLHATDPNALIADCAYLSDDNVIMLVAHTIELSSHIITNQKQYFA
ncbi:MAG: TIR domain-containing protein, partial [Anaerolineae bacterium]|nr:TIR domain-containing protein [Anaerolineae bacterium]